MDTRARAEELAEMINSSTEWDAAALEELCTLAGLGGEWAKADGETFEALAYRAEKILGVEI